MQEGYLIADKNRRAVFVELLAGETNLQRITRKHRLIGRVAERALEDLKAQGVVEERDGGLALTAEGQRAGQELKRRSLLE